MLAFSPTVDDCAHSELREKLLKYVNANTDISPQEEGVSYVCSRSRGSSASTTAHPTAEPRPIPSTSTQHTQYLHRREHTIHAHLYRNSFALLMLTHRGDGQYSVLVGLVQNERSSVVGFAFQIYGTIKTEVTSQSVS